MDRTHCRGSEMKDEDREVLSLLTEDFYSPWEIAIQVAVGRGDLEQVIRRLLADGFAEWFRRDDDSAPAVHWPSEVAEPDLPASQTWEAAGLADPQILLGITDAGTSAYYQR
jgi:hypothetical protein